MKSVIFCLLILFYIFLYYFYVSIKPEILQYVYQLAPKLYSVENENILTISFSKFNSGKFNSEEISLLPNQNFDYKPKILDIDDTNELYNYGLKCSPSSLGFSKEDGDRIFPHYIYPDCSIVTGIKSSSLHINRKENQIYIDCENEAENFVYGPFSQDTLIDYSDTNALVSQNSDPVTDKNVEFGLGTCKNDKIPYMHAVLEPVFNEKAYNYAETMKEPGKPTIIYFLTLDSFSRRHFFRKLTKTVKLFNSLKDTYPDWVVYDFKLHSTFGHTSVENQVPILGKFENYVESFNGYQYIDKLGKNALWNILREKGYISLMGFDDCDWYFPKSLGRNPNVDYSVRQFYCYVKKQTKITTEYDGGSNQRCLGPFMSHYYLLNFTHSVIKLNQGVNQWIYLHLNAAHELTGQHAGTLDNDLYYFLDLLIKEYSSNNNIIVLLQGDHGNNFKQPSEGERQGDFEKRLPALFFLANKSLLNKFNSSYHPLHENTNRLILKQDLRETMLSLANISEKSRESINLFTEIAPKSRNCKDISISSEWCACSTVEEKKNDDFTPYHIKLFEKLKRYAEYELNSLSYSHKNHFLRRICKKITLDEITSVLHFYINNVNELYRMVITSNTRQNMKFQIDFFLASDNNRMDIDNTLFRPINLNHKAYKIKARVIII